MEMKLETVLIAEGWFKEKGFKTTVDRVRNTLDIKLFTEDGSELWVQVSNEEIEYRADKVLTTEW